MADEGSVETEEMDLLELWGIIYKRKWLIAALFVVAVIAAVVASSLMEPVYEASGTLLVKGQQSSPLAFMDGFGGGQTNPIQNHMQVLRSRTLMAKVADALGTEIVSASDLDRMANRLNLQAVQNTEVLRISVESTDPEEASRMVNTVVSVFLDFNRDSNQAEMRGAREFISEQLSIVAAQLAADEERLREYRQAERMLAPQEEIEAAVSQQLKFDSDLMETRVKLLELDERAAQISARLESEDETGVSSQTIAANPFVERYRGRLSDLEISLSGAKERYTERHPTVLGLQAEITEVRTLLAEEVERIVSSETVSVNPVHRDLYGRMIELEVERMALRSREEALWSLKGETEDIFSSLPKKELELARLMRDAKVSEELYIMLRKRNEEIRISEAMQTSNAQILDRAVAPEQPVRPRMRLNMAIAGVLGLFVGVGLAFLLAFIDNTVKTKEEVERLLGLPVLGQIPDFSDDNRKQGRLGLRRRQRM